MNYLRRDILATLKHSDRLSASEIHHRLNGNYRLTDIEAELIAMDLDGECVNDLVPMARITTKGKKRMANAG